MKVKFIQDCEIYPDGKTPVRVGKNAEMELAEDYGKLVIDKGHAVAVGGKVEPKGKSAAEG